MEKQREKNRLVTALGVSELVRRGVERRKNSPKILLFDIAVAASAFLFVRAPFAFGAHPFAAAFVAALGQRVWFALLGTLLGAITLGEGGVIYALSSMIIVFLRIIVSAGGRRQESAVFGEGVLVRMSVSVIGGFICAVYESLLNGLNTTSVLFGLSMIIIPPALVFAYVGVLDGGIDLYDIFFSGGTCGRVRAALSGIGYRISALVFLFALSFSLREYSALGISAGLLFASLAALICARRLGAVYGAAVGFVCSLAIGGAYSAAFLLAGLIAGISFGFGAAYALVFGAVGLVVFSAYVGGALGVSSVLPEYALAATLLFPIIKKIKPIYEKSEASPTDRDAIDMVGTMALSYKSAPRKSVREMHSVMSHVASSIDAFLSKKPTYDELLNMVFSVINQRIPYVQKDENIENIATKLYNNVGISRSDLAYLGESDELVFLIFNDIRQTYDSLVRAFTPPAAELRLYGKIINEITLAENAELAMSEQMTDRAEQELQEEGFSDFTVRVFGQRRHHVILAGEDRDGSLITSPRMLSALERALGGPVGTPEFFRRGSMALMETTRAKKYSVSYASVGEVASGSDISGDVARRIETDDARFYALISDGMGSGEIARSGAEFVASFMGALLSVSAPTDSVVHLVNSYLCRGREECSVTLDLFSLDLYNKEATFLKSGGAPSYVKRGNSIFRIRSQTAPLGLMSSVDTEKIRVQVEVGDYVIMMSDGVSGVPEDAPWLLELISARAPDSLSDFARSILARAKRHHKNCDDMTVTVMRIESV